MIIFNFYSTIVNKGEFGSQKSRQMTSFPLTSSFNIDGLYMSTENKSFLGCGSENTGLSFVEIHLIRTCSLYMWEADRKSFINIQIPCVYSWLLMNCKNYWMFSYWRKSTRLCMSALKHRSILAEKKSSFSTDSNSVLSKQTTVADLFRPLIKASSCESKRYSHKHQ